MRAWAVAGVLLACGLGSVPAHAVFPSGSPDDYFLCYQAKTTTSTPAFTPQLNVSIDDGHAPANFNVSRPLRICNPASVAVAPNPANTIVDPDTHLESYQIRAVTGAPAYVPQTNIRVVNQLGEIVVDTKKPVADFVPTAMDLTMAPPPPNNASHNVDHYKCSSAKITKGQLKFPRGIQVTVGDQTPFTNPAKLFDVKKPKHLCFPANQSGSGIKRSSGFLMCYKVKPASSQPRHTPVLALRTANEFPLAQAETLDTRKESELCIPSVVNPVCGDNVVNQLSEQCDGTDDSACPGECSRLCQCRQPFPLVLDDANSRIDVRGISTTGVGLDNSFTFPGLAGTITIYDDGVMTPGQYGISVPVTTLPPLDINIPPFGSIGTACVFLVEDPELSGSGLSGIGVLNCFGTPVASIPSPHFNTHLDHCTNGVTCNSGMPAGCAGDLGAGGKVHTATGLCVPAAPADASCTSADPLTGTSAKLESAAGSDPHDGVCNSPLYGVFGAPFWNPGDAVLTLNAAIEIRGPGDPCMGPPTGSPIRGPMTTATATSSIMDAFPSDAPIAGKVQAISVSGTRFTCLDPLPAPPAAPITSTSGVAFVTAAGALDIPVPSFGLADLNTALTLTAQ